MSPLVMADAKRPDLLWEQFTTAIGPELAAKAYREDRRMPLPGETVWVFYEQFGSPAAGWCSRVMESRSSYEIAAGVWPAFSNRGIRTEMVRAVSNLTFRQEAAVVQLRSGILLSNPAHLRRMNDQWLRGGAWHRTAIEFSPLPGQMWFTLTRERWKILTSKRLVAVGA